MRSDYTPLHAITWVRKTKKGDGVDGVPPPLISQKTDGLDFVRKLVSKGTNVNTRLVNGAAPGNRLHLEGATPFLMAAATCDLPLLKLLVELGANTSTPNSRGTSPLLAAAGVGTIASGEEAGIPQESLKTVAYLLDLGAEINAVNKHGVEVPPPPKRKP